MRLICILACILTIVDATTTCDDTVCVQCQRNEILLDDVCVCPDSKITCGEVTPFNNIIITAACTISTVAILVHVIHEIAAKYMLLHKDGKKSDSQEVKKLLEKMREERQFAIYRAQ